MKYYKLLQKAWEKNPPGQWLTAARYGYKAPEGFGDAINNTLQMGEAMMASQALGKKVIN